jgi:hypothetical protein
MAMCSRAVQRALRGGSWGRRLRRCALSSSRVPACPHLPKPVTLGPPRCLPRRRPCRTSHLRELRLTQSPQVTGAALRALLLTAPPAQPPPSQQPPDDPASPWRAGARLPPATAPLALPPAPPSAGLTPAAAALRHLSLRGCSRLRAGRGGAQGPAGAGGGAALAPLASLPQLESLDISGAACGRGGVRAPTSAWPDAVASAVRPRLPLPPYRLSAVCPQRRAWRAAAAWRASAPLRASRGWMRVGCRRERGDLGG